MSLVLVGEPATTFLGGFHVSEPAHVDLGNRLGLRGVVIRIHGNAKARALVGHLVMICDAEHALCAGFQPLLRAIDAAATRSHAPNFLIQILANFFERDRVATHLSLLCLHSV